MNTAQQPMYGWQDLPWKQIERSVFKLQKRIYQASRRGDTKSIHKLQRLLISSWSARCLAVRRVTQDNRGKKTAGVDGIKSLTPQQRLCLAETLTLPQTASPTRRVWIPKPGKEEKRPLGIPTMQNRAQQALAKLALEPEWEARFEPNSYGFRPGRGCHDAVAAIFQAICHKPKYVLDADIAKCFDRIDHQALLAKLHTFPKMKRAIHAWLKAGVLDSEELFPTDEGVPQGGPLSPLLANIALHGLEEAVAANHPKARVIRYADDLVAFHPNCEEITAIQGTISNWLAGMGLELKPSKTRITHTLIEHDGNIGFDFLGFHIRQYKVGKTHSGKTSHGELLGFKTIIKPSREAMRRHNLALKLMIRKHLSAPQAQLIGRLNPIIKGWTAYYATVASKEVFNKMADLTFYKLRRWTRRRHPHKSRKWLAKKYWHPHQGRKWDFIAPDGNKLYQHYQTPVRRHVKVRGKKSPYDGDWPYWVKRKGAYPGIPKRVAALLRKQKGRCAICELYFKDEDVLEVDHITPRAKGGGNHYGNLQLLHSHCHHKKTAENEKLRRLEALMTSTSLVRSRMSGNAHVRF
jgi:RNA-directed DNA polymerase